MRSIKGLSNSFSEPYLPNSAQMKNKKCTKNGDFLTLDSGNCRNLIENK